jgi:undecaprenyl-diphosphatase
MQHLVSRVIDWLGGHNLIVLLGLLVVTLGTWAFVELADEVAEGETQALDERIVLWMRSPDDPRIPKGPAWLQEVGRDLTALGGYALLTLVTVAVVGFLWLDRKFAAMFFVLGAVLSGLLLTMGLKALFERPRPAAELHLSLVATSSFPSGHSMMSAIVYLTLGGLLTTLVGRRRLKFYFLAIAVLLTALVGVSRVYMGVHYPTDVLAGWSGGLVWATLCCLLARWLQHRGRIDKEL